MKLLKDKELEQFNSFIKSFELKEMWSETFKVIASNGSVDSDWDTVDVKGWDLERFLKNPVILIDHQYKVENIVWKATKIYVEWKDLIIEWVFSNTEKWKLVKELYNQWFLKSVSVWFAVKKFDESNRNKILEQELRELSFVAIWANPDALSLDDKSIKLAKSLNLIKEDDKIDIQDEIENAEIVDLTDKWPLSEEELDKLSSENDKEDKKVDKNDDNKDKNIELSNLIDIITIMKDEVSFIKGELEKNLAEVKQYREAKIAEELLDWLSSYNKKYK